MKLTEAEVLQTQSLYSADGKNATTPCYLKIRPAKSARFRRQSIHT